ncbi:MAG: hypothetical protein H8D97_00520 [Proteobacteria bacterium]|nr:hypothetical protein [Pseudomonadota bacterium]
MEQIKKEILDFIQKKNDETKTNRKVKNIEFIKIFNYGKKPIACFEVETDDEENGPYWLTFISREDSDIPNAIYNVNMFNHQIIEEMGIDIFLATFNFHIGMMKSGMKSIEILMEEAKNATKH